MRVADPGLSEIESAFLQCFTHIGGTCYRWFWMLSANRVWNVRSDHRISGPRGIHSHFGMFGIDCSSHSEMVPVDGMEFVYVFNLYLTLCHSAV